MTTPRPSNQHQNRSEQEDTFSAGSSSIRSQQPSRLPDIIATWLCPQRGGSEGVISMCVSVPQGSLLGLVRGCLPDVEVKGIETEAAPRPGRLYRVILADSSALMLSMPPPPADMLLRCEEFLAGPEPNLLRWIAQASPALEGYSRSVPSMEYAAAQMPSPMPSEGAAELPGFLSPLVPSPIAHFRLPNELGGDCTIMTALPGVALSTLIPSMTPATRDSIDFQTGQIHRRISLAISPSGMFGPAARVLDFDGKTGNRNIDTPPDGVSSMWSATFQGMLEAVLRDGEDMSIMLSYASVRRAVDRYRYVLDVVATPRLVVLGVGDPRVIAVRQDSSGVAGLNDWSNCLFGDPFIARRFSEEPAGSFRSGFETPLDVEGSMPAIGGEPHVECRILLYEVYHSLVDIMQAFSRKATAGMDEELAARRRLNEALSKLEGR